jgi:hypothetical protein
MDPIPEAEEVCDHPGRSAFSAADVEAIVRRRGWLPVPADARGLSRGTPENREAEPDFTGWMSEAARLLGTRASDPASLERLLECVFTYEAAELLARPENQAVLSREGARDVLRELAVRVLDLPAVDSDRFKEIVSALKEATGRRGPGLFHPVRLALAGCAGEGQYDRVILLLDGAARLPWAIPLKSCRQRILEFCSVLD